MKIAAYAMYGGSRGRGIANATVAGARRHGFEAVVCGEFRGVEADVAVAYGWAHEEVFRAYRDAGRRFVYFDLGYWRREGQTGFHRYAIDDWDTATFMLRDCPGDRFDALGVRLSWPVDRPDGTILLCGMSDKAAGTHGFAPGQWEGKAAEELRKKYPDREIVFRQKPNRQTRHLAIPPLAEDMRRAAIVVSHHSNCSVDALVAGVPSWAKKGVGSLFRSHRTIDGIALDPSWFPDEETRLQILRDVAYAQVDVGEIERGVFFDIAKERLT